MGLSIEKQREIIRAKKKLDCEYITVVKVKVKKAKKTKNSKPKKTKKQKANIKKFNKDYREYLSSDKWAQIKLDIYSYRGYKCERCGAKRKLHLHHKTYINFKNEEPEDLEILCEKCHREEHKRLNKQNEKQP